MQPEDKFVVHQLSSFCAPLRWLLKRSPTTVPPCRRALASRASSTTRIPIRQHYPLRPWRRTARQSFGSHQARKDTSSAEDSAFPRARHPAEACPTSRPPCIESLLHGTFRARFDTKRSLARFAPKHSQVLRDSFDHGGGQECDTEAGVHGGHILQASYPCTT